MGIASMIGGGAYGQLRSKLNTVTLVIAFVLSIMVINNYRQCGATGYPESKPIVNSSYYLSILILVVACILFAMDLFFMVMKKSPI